ncbi:hypothetical protein ABL78_4541 [Leptomonas seymouri]|uniref:Uncharacterized protein n=1 Tax=Leptomonas seymouri TaxID=5684 RepID=A0A0N1HY21_LEPSE|nr:hypothetical protein ABL78_4541 [Leptomonas seymouri]|eukprot:KPI86390.1 hypothetical protein ABL78_4541 [Leptomonas seymouri]
MLYPVEVKQLGEGEDAVGRKASLDYVADDTTGSRNLNGSRRQQRQNSPPLRVHSASLTRRQKLLEVQQQQQKTCSATSSSQSSTGTQRSSGDDHCGPEPPDSPVVVYGRQNGFPLISDDEPDTAVAVPRNARPHRRTSPTATAVFQEQQKAPDGESQANALPSTLRAHPHTPRGTPDKPPLGRAPMAAVELSADAFTSSTVSECSEGNVGMEGSSADVYPVEPSPQNVLGSTAAHMKDDDDTEVRQEVFVDVLEHLTASATPRSPFRQRCSDSTSTVTPSKSEVCRTKAAATTAEHNAGASTHLGSPALHRREEEPMRIAVNRRRSLHLARVSPHNSRRSSLHPRREVSTQACITPAFVEVHAVGERKMSVDQVPWRGIYGSWPAFHEAEAMRRRSRQGSQYADNQQEPLPTGKDEKQPTMRTVNPHLSPAKDSSAAKTSSTASAAQTQQHLSRSAHAVDGEAQPSMPAADCSVATAPQRSNLDANRRSSSHAVPESQLRLVEGDVEPTELKMASPKTMVAAPATCGSADTSDRRQSVRAAFSECTQQQGASLHAQTINVISTNDARRRGSQHATMSADPWFTDADVMPATLKTVVPQQLVSKPASAPPRCSIHGQLLSDDGLGSDPTQVGLCANQLISALVKQGATCVEGVASITAADAQGRRHSGHGTEVNTHPVTPLEADAAFQPLRVADLETNDSKPAACAKVGEIQPSAPCCKSQQEANCASTYSPIVPTRQRVYSVFLPPLHASVDVYAEEGGEGYGGVKQLHSRVSQQSSYSDVASASASHSRNYDKAAASVTTGASGRAVVSSSGCEDQLRERSQHAIDGDRLTERPQHEEESSATATAAHNRTSTTMEREHNALPSVSAVAGGVGNDDRASADSSRAQRHPEAPAVRNFGVAGRNRRTSSVAVAEWEPIRAPYTTVEEPSTSVDRNGAHGGKVHDEEMDEAEYEMISCYDVSCQTSQHLLQSHPETLVRASEDAARAAAASLDTPHYMSANRWMCALGLCPQCHPSRLTGKAHNCGGVNNAGRCVWPIVPRSSTGYSAPPRPTHAMHHLHPHRPLAMTAPQSAVPSAVALSARAARPHKHTHLPYLASAAGRSPRKGEKAARRPQLRSPVSPFARPPSVKSAAAARNNIGEHNANGERQRQRDMYSSNVTAYQGGYCFTREWDYRQRQRERQLYELRVEQSGRHGGGSSAYTPRLLTLHDVQSTLPMSGFRYRYCDLESEKMMVHNPSHLGRINKEMPLDSYNDTLNGAPLMSRHADSSRGGRDASNGRMLLTAANAEEAQLRMHRTIKPKIRRDHCKGTTNSELVAVDRCN